MTQIGDSELQNRALRLLGRREHSRLELWFKLYRNATDESQLNRVLDELETGGWLDNARFAEVFARQRRETGYGPVRIRAELDQRGVTSEPETLADVTEADWCVEARRQRVRRFGAGEPRSWKEKGRQGRFLAQRGFSQSHIRAALGSGGLDDGVDGCS